MTHQKHDFEAGSQPPYTNRGVPSVPPLSRFDWYQASFEGAADSVAALFLRDFGGSFTDIKGVNTYEFGLRHDGQSFSLFWGGRNTGIFAVASGGDAHHLAEWIRANFPEHRVSRADVAIDFRGQSIEGLVAITEPIARKARASVIFVGDPDPKSGKGRTWYFGSKSSDVRVRIYEKGLEQRAKGVEDSPEDWVRFEGQFRPRKERKAKAAKWTPEEFFTMGKWANEAANKVAGLSGTYQPDESKRRNTDEQTFEYLLLQYGPLIKRMVEKQGWFGFCRYLFVSLFSPKEREQVETKGWQKAKADDEAQAMAYRMRHARHRADERQADVWGPIEKARR